MTNIKHKNLIFLSVFVLTFIFTNSAGAFYTYSSFGTYYDDYSVLDNYSAKQPAPATVIASSARTNKTATKTIVQPETQNIAVQTENYNSDNNLKALSVSGSNDFMPDTVFEWVLVVIFILVIIILARQFRKKE